MGFPWRSSRFVFHFIHSATSRNVNPVTNPVKQTQGQKAAIGHRPLLLFHGDAFETHEDLRTVRSIFMDLYRGDQTAEMVNLAGLEHVISITAQGGSEGNKKVHMRVYTVHLKKSGTKLPRVELEEMGPEIDFVLRRYRLADKETWKMATKVPKQVKVRVLRRISGMLFFS